MIDSHQILRHSLDFGWQVGWLVVWLVMLVAIFVPLEHMFALHPAKFWRKQVGIDLCWYFINSLLPATVVVVPLMFLARWLDGNNPLGLYSLVAAWPFWVKALLALIIADIGSYWYHRASHALPFLWRFHAIHHSAEHVDWLVNTRSHPIDMVFTRLAGLVPVYLLGLAQPASAGHASTTSLVPLVLIAGTLWSFFIHANIRVRLGPLEWVISTPAFHHWHHTNDAHRDHNFAAIFPIIDRIFGTAWLPRYWPPVYGIDGKVPPTLAGQFLDPLMEEAPAAGPVSEKQEMPSHKD
jgi:sterol desaturase/sphingolipid hydroxylase (fatty acid hydroxylase superfamily)